MPPTARLFGSDADCDAVSFTPAEVAVLRIIADELRDQGGRGLSIDEITAQAGVCHRTAQTALRHAEWLGLISIEERWPGRCNLPHIMRMMGLVHATQSFVVSKGSETGICVFVFGEFARGAPK